MFAEQRRAAEVVDRRSGEASKRPHVQDRALELGMRHRHQQSARLDLPAVHDVPGGGRRRQPQAELDGLLVQLVEGSGEQEPFDDGGDLVVLVLRDGAVVLARPVPGRQDRIAEALVSHPGHQRRVLRLAAARDQRSKCDTAVLAAPGEAELHAFGMRAEANGLAHRVRVQHLSGERHVERRPGDVILDAHVDVLASTGELASIVRHQRPGGPLSGAVPIGQVGADADRRSIGVTVDVQESAERLKGQIRGRELTVRTALAKRGDGREDDARVDLRERLIPQVQCVQIARPE